MNIAQDLCHWMLLTGAAAACILGVSDLQAGNLQTVGVP